MFSSSCPRSLTKTLRTADDFLHSSSIMFSRFGLKMDPNEHGSCARVVLWLSPSYPYSVFSDALSSSLSSFSGCERQIVSRPVDRQGTMGHTIQMRRNARLSSVSQALHQNMINPSPRQAALGRSVAKGTGLAANGLRMNVRFTTAL